jgi:hypothetical protein
LSRGRRFGGVCKWSESDLLQRRLAQVNDGVFGLLDEPHLFEPSHTCYYVHHGCCDVCADVVTELIDLQQLEITSANVSWQTVIEGLLNITVHSEKESRQAIKFHATPCFVRGFNVYTPSKPHLPRLSIYKAVNVPKAVNYNLVYTYPKSII